MSSLLNSKQTAELLGVHVQTLRRWDEDGSFPSGSTPTGMRFYTPDQVTEYLDGGKHCSPLLYSSRVVDPLVQVAEVLIAERVRDSLSCRVTAALVEAAIATGVDSSVLLSHLSSLSSRGGIPEEASTAAGTLFLKILKYDAVLPDIQKRATEEFVLSTRDIDQSSTQKAIARALIVLKHTGCTPYNGDSDGDKRGFHKALWLRGRKARWFLPPAGVGPDPKELARMFLPDYDWSPLC